MKRKDPNPLEIPLELERLRLLVLFAHTEAPKVPMVGDSFGPEARGPWLFRKIFERIGQFQNIATPTSLRYFPQDFVGEFYIYIGIMQLIFMWKEQSELCLLIAKIHKWHSFGDKESRLQTKPRVLL